MKNISKTIPRSLTLVRSLVLGFLVTPILFAHSSSSDSDFKTLRAATGVYFLEADRLHPADVGACPTQIRLRAEKENSFIIQNIGLRIAASWDGSYQRLKQPINEMIRFDQINQNSTVRYLMGESTVPGQNYKTTQSQRLITNQLIQIIKNTTDMGEFDYQETTTLYRYEFTTDRIAYRKTISGKSRNGVASENRGISCIYYLLYN